MTLPSGVTYGQVKFRAVTPAADDTDGDGSPNSTPDTGQVTFTLAHRELIATDATDPVTIVSAPLSYALGADGVLRDNAGNESVTLIATDSTGIRVPLSDGESATDPEWYWVASFQLANGRLDPFGFELPTGEVVDLSDVTPLEVSAGVQTVVGPPGASGKSAYQSWLDLGNVGTEADFIASLTGPTGPAGSGNLNSVNGDTGPDVTLTADNIGDGTTKVTMTADERTKLAGIEAGATASSAIADISGLQDALDVKLGQSDVEAVADARIGAALQVLQYDDIAGSWGGQVRPPGARPVLWVYPNDITAVPNTGTVSGGTLEAVDGLDLHAKYTRS